MVHNRIMYSGLVLVACMLSSMIPPTGAVNRCGTSYATAGNQCKLCPNGVDSECGPGQHCYASLPACSGNPPPASGGGKVNRCGTSFATAGNQCNLCPKGVDSECGPGQHCYAGLPSCSGNGPTGGGGSGPTGTTFATLNSQQRQNAGIIIQVGKQNNIPQRGWVVALATAMQESQLINLNYGDQDSQGLFQQRPSQGWGTIAQITNPTLSTEAFYGVSKHTRNPGLLQIKGWQQLTIGQACQAVQVSEFPDRYAKWEPLARDIVAKL